MSTTNDVLAAMNSLAESIRGVSISNSIKKAQSKVDELQADNSKNEFERIKAQQAIAQNVASSVLAYGGNASQAQTAMASLAPNIPDAAMARLEATGASTIGEAQQKLAEEAEKKQLDSENRAFKRQEALQKSSQLHAERMAKLKGDNKPPPKIGKTAESTLDNLLTRRTGLIDLQNRFDKEGGATGTIAGRLPDITSALPGARMLGFTPEAVAYRSQIMQDFNEYRRIVTGAAASIPELKSLRPATITEDDTAENLKAKMAGILKAGELVARMQMRKEARKGVDVTPWAEEFGLSAEEFTGGSGIPKGPAPLTPSPASGIPGLTKRKKE